MVVVLAGGVGAARFLRGLVKVVPATEITVVGNTGDDIEIYGARVSPDLDIVTYMLGGVFDAARGFGIIGDTHHVMAELSTLGEDIWFTLGDRDLGVCVARTRWLADGVPLHECARRIAKRFGVEVTLLPMTDDRVETRVVVRDAAGNEVDLHFQEYWVRRRAADPVVSVRLVGVEQARPAPGVLEAIARADAVLLAPSNPVVSIGTILSVPGIRDAMQAVRARTAAISPIIGGRVVRGMADKLLGSAGAEVSARGVAALYRDVVGGFVIDEVDAAHAPAVEALGMRVAVTNTMMDDPDDAAALAKAALELCA